MNKAELRKIYKSQRLALNSEEVEAKSEAIFEQFKNSEFVQCDIWNCFLPIKKWNEVNTHSIINYGLRLKKTLAVPKVQGDELLNCQIEGKTQFVTSNWGIPEPVQCQSIKPEKFDLILTPLLICDEKGNRIGYGKGYYDKLFGETNPNAWKVGLSFFEPIEEISNINSLDIPLNALITPYKVYKFKK